MLNIIEYGKDGYEFPALVVLGCFDAIHAGHRELLKKAKLQAKINGLDLGVMMFKEGKSGKLVYSFEERCAILEQFNVKFVLAVDFNDEFKAVAPLDFLREVEEKINVKAYMSGKDFRFGAQAKGKSSTLKNYAEDEENGVWYMPVKDVDLNGEKISTTLIKTCLDKGNVAKANQLLGAEFSVSGKVVKGEGRGTSVVGFPTVNIVYPDWKHLLKHGVYSVKCLVGDAVYQGIANFGNCPTFADERVALEVYLEGFSGDLYGQILTVSFIDYIRDIEEFGSAEELSGQLQNDLLTVSDELAVAEPEPVAVEEEVAVIVAVQPEKTAVKETAEEIPTEAAVETGDEITAETAEQPEKEVVKAFEEEVVDEIIDEVAEEMTEPSVEDLADETTETAVVEEAPVETTVSGEVEVQPQVIFTEEIQAKTVADEGYVDLSDDGLDEFFESTDEEYTAEEQPEESVEETVEEVTETSVEEEQTEESEQSVEEPAQERQDEPVEEISEEQQDGQTEEIAEEFPSENTVPEEMQYTEGEETIVNNEQAEEATQHGEADEETSSGEEN